MSDSSRQDALGATQDGSLSAPVQDEDGTPVVNLDKQRSGPTILDPGLRNTAICRTGISYIDGVTGTILYRRYSLDDLARHASYPEVVCLLLDDNIPTQAEVARFEDAARRGRSMETNIESLIAALPQGTQPLIGLGMGIAAVEVVSSAAKNDLKDSLDDASKRLIGLAPSVVEAFLRHRGDRTVMPNAADTHLAAVLHATCAVTRPLNASVQEQLRLLEVLLLAHAEHGMNCSTTAVRVVGSAGASAAAAIASGIFCFSGRFHGGAADRVAGMLRAIGESGLSAQEWLDRTMEGDPAFRLYGFGHRVYRTEDPRAAVLRTALDRYAQADGYEDPLYRIATELAGAATIHPYFRDRQIFPNVDLYSGSCFRALGIPEDLNSTVIAIGRMAGWLAHWREATYHGSPIIRPRDLHEGFSRRLEWPRRSVR